MITLPVTPSTDNKACFIFRINTKDDEFWVSSSPVTVTLSGFAIDSNTILFGSDGIIQTLVNGAIKGGTFDTSGSVDLNILSSPNSMTSTFFNGFYPNTSKVLQGALVSVYIWWTDMTIATSGDYANLISLKLYSGKIVSYSYNTSINLTIENNDAFANDSLPVYATQNEIDNKISYINTVDTDLLDVIVPLVYGDYYATYADSGVWYSTGSSVPIIRMDDDNLTYKICSHKALSASVSDNENTPLLYEKGVNQSYQICTVDTSDPDIPNTTTFSAPLSGSKFIFHKIAATDNLFFTGNMLYMLDANGAVPFYPWSGTATQIFLDNTADRATGTFPAITVTLGNYTNLCLGKAGDIMRSYSMYHLSGAPNTRGSVTIIVELENLTASTQHLYIRAGDNRNAVNLTYIGNYVDITLAPNERATFIGDVLVDIVRWTVNPSIDNINTEYQLTEYQLSVTDLLFSFLNPDSNTGSIKIHTANIYMYGFVVGGTFAGRVTRGYTRRNLTNSDARYAIPLLAVFNDVLYKDKYFPTSYSEMVTVGDVPGLTAYTTGRVFSNYFEYAYGWINLPSRTSGYSANDRIDHPAYVIESIIRDEAQKLIDLQATEALAVSTNMFIYLEDLPFNNIEGFYVGAVIGFPSIGYEYVIETHEPNGAIGSGNNVIGINNASSMLNKANVEASILYINNINTNINTASFDYIAKTPSGVLDGWRIRVSLSNDLKTKDILSSLCAESFMLLVNKASGISLIDIFDTTLNGTLSKPLNMNGTSQIAFQLDSLDNVNTEIILNYDYNPANGEYRKTITKNRHNSTDCATAYNLFSTSNTQVFDSKYHYDPTTAASFMDRLVSWTTMLHSIVTYVGDVNTHIKYEVGDKVKINYSKKIPTSMNNTTIFMIIGKEIVQFPVPSIKFTLIDLPS